MANARRSDPHTSHEAAQSIDDVTKTQQFVLRSLKRRPQCDVELVDTYRSYKTAPMASESGIRTRRHELVESGLVTDTGKRTVLPSGRRAIVWGIA